MVIMLLSFMYIAREIDIWFFEGENNLIITTANFPVEE